MVSEIKKIEEIVQFEFIVTVSHLGLKVFASSCLNSFTVDSF